MIQLPVSHITLARACYQLDLWIKRFVLLHLDGAPADTEPQSYLIFGDAIEHSVRRWMTGLYAQAHNPVYSYRFAQVTYEG
jgi:hypothetical protein